MWADPTMSTRQWHGVPVANWLLVEPDAPRCAQRKDGLPFCPRVEARWYLGKSHDGFAYANAQPAGALGMLLTVKVHAAGLVDHRGSLPWCFRILLVGSRVSCICMLRARLPSR